MKTELAWRSLKTAIHLCDAILRLIVLALAAFALLGFLSYSARAGMQAGTMVAAKINVLLITNHLAGMPRPIAALFPLLGLPLPIAYVWIAANTFDFALPTRILWSFWGWVFFITDK